MKRKFCPAQVVTVKKGTTYLTSLSKTLTDCWEYASADYMGIVLYEESKIGFDAYWVILECDKRVLIESTNFHVMK